MSELPYEYENYKEEIIDGKIYLMAPATPSHGITMAKLFLAFGNYLEDKPCLVFSDTLGIYYSGNKSKDHIKPDVSIICDKTKFSKRGYEGAPDLTIEILSRGTMDYDKTIKLKLYEKMGVREYWIVDNENKAIDQYVLNNENKFDLIRSVSIVEDWEYEMLTEEQKQIYNTIIKPTIFNDLEIDLHYIFGWSLE